RLSTQQVPPLPHQQHPDAMKTGHVDPLIDDVVRGHERLAVEGARALRQGEEVVFAADVTRPGELVVEEEATHQEEVGGVQHLLQSGGQAAVSLEEAELSQRRLLILRSLLRERRLQGIAPLVRPILGRQLQLGEQAIAEWLRQVVLELLDQPLFAYQRQQLAPSLAEETLGGLRRRFEVALQMCQSMPLELVLARALDLATRDVGRDGVEVVLYAKLIDGEARRLFREAEHEP